MAALAVVELLGITANASAQRPRDGAEDPLALRFPARLTAGSANHFMGVQSAHGSALYFVGDDDGTNELYVQAPTSEAPEGLLGGTGDVAWPVLRGERLAYVSYARDAAGDACVLDLATGRERCLPRPGSAELQVVWLDDAHLGVLSRNALHEGYALRRVPVDGGEGERFLERNMVGLAVSPDGRWLAYVALEREQEGVGITFASQVAAGIWLQRLDRLGVAPRRYVPALPGKSGYPTFAADGRHLYFSQYLNDTNRDGRIDGGDNSVIVRAPLDLEAEAPLASASAEQLTSARWNCHYPSVAGERLVMTCAPQGLSLDVYTMDAAGAVPPTMDAERLRGEVRAARDLWTRLLLQSRLLSLESRPALLRAIVSDHLSLGELESAGWYAEALARAGDPEDARWASLVGTLVIHRREDRLLRRGAPGEDYARGARARYEAAAPTASDTAATRALALLVRSEIADDLGDKVAALEALRAVEAAPVDDARVLRLYASRGATLHALLADRDAQLALLAELTTHEALDAAERLRHAHALVHELLRGVPRARHEARLGAAPGGGEALDFLLEVERALSRLGTDESAAILDRLLTLYRAHRDQAFRRSLTLRVVQEAVGAGDAMLAYEFVTAWTSQIPRDDPQRKYAVELYRTIVLERAYGELQAGRRPQAAALFFATWRNTGSLEAHQGFLEARAEDPDFDAVSFYADRYEEEPDDPEYGFVRAYLGAAELRRRVEQGPRPALEAASLEGPSEHGTPFADGFGEATDAVLARLEAVDEARPRTLEVQHLWGYVLHLRALVGDARRAAAGAVLHYGLALDLARARPRHRAALQSALGQLQAALGNHYAAVEVLAPRARLPFVTPRAELAFRLLYGRSLFHTRRLAEARTQLEAAAALLREHEALGAHRAHVQDRLAFYRLHSGQAAEAAEAYRALVSAAPEDDAEARLKAYLGLATAELRLGRYAESLAAIDQAEARLLVLRADRREPRLRSDLVRHYDYGVDRYRALLAGLRADALVGEGRWDDARAALTLRREGLEALNEAEALPEDLEAIAITDLRLAEVALAEALARDRVPEVSRPLLERGLDVVAEYEETTGAEISEPRLLLLRQLAELALYRSVPAPSNLEARLAATYETLCRIGNPRWREHRFRLQLYLTLLRLRGR